MLTISASTRGKECDVPLPCTKPRKMYFFENTCSKKCNLYKLHFILLIYILKKIFANLHNFFKSLVKHSTIILLTYQMLLH